MEKFLMTIGGMATPPDGFYDAAAPASDVISAAGEFRELMQRVRGGSEEAAWKLIDIYAPHIFSAVRRKLNVRIRSKFDSEDFVQAVWASFFTSRTDALRFNEPEDLISFLVGMAYHKVIAEVRHRMVYMRHNVNQEESLHDSTVPAPEAPVGHQPSPSQVAVARERWQRMVAGQPPVHQKILALRYAGETYARIAEQVGMNERSVRKVIEQALTSQ